MSGGLIIRPTELTDALDINELCRNELGYDFPPEQTEEKLKAALCSSGCRIFTAEMGGKVVGFIHAEDYDVLYFPHMKNILGIAVSKEFRRMGIGSELLSAVEKWAKGSGAAGIRLCSGAERTSAHQFYQSCGYILSKQQFNFKKMFTQKKGETI